MRVLIACECSGRVRDAFAKRGHNAWSCDLKPSEVRGKHIQGNVLDILGNGWDLMVAHPPCTFLSSSGVRWLTDSRFPTRKEDQRKAVEFVNQLWNAPIPKLCIENPIGMLSTLFLPPTQIIDPLDFGHGQTKATCLWLRGLPNLVPPSLFEVPTFEQVNHANLSYAWKMAKDERRATNRARTFTNIAWAMAQQWG